MRRPNLTSFSLSFVGSMRQEPWLRYMPTVRTGVALTRLLAARQLRQGVLTGDDFVDCACLVTPPEDQETAREVAVSVLSTPAPLPFKKPGQRNGSGVLSEILKETNLANQEFHEEETGSLGRLLLDPDFARFIELAGGQKEMQARFASEEGFKSFAGAFIREQIGGLDELLFPLGLKLGLAPVIARESSSLAERVAAQVVLGETSLAWQWLSLSSFDLKLKTLRLLSSAFVDVSGHLQILADEADTFARLSAAASVGYVAIDRERMFALLKTSIPEVSFEELFRQTDSFASELAGPARAELYNGDYELTEFQLAEHAHLCLAWKDALGRAVERRANKAAGSGFGRALTLVRELFDLFRSQSDPVLSQHLHEGLAGAAEGALKSVAGADELMELIHASDAMGCTLDPARIRQQGQKLGMNSRDLDQILHSRLALFKRMVGEGEKSYERFLRLIEKERPSQENTKKLAESALRRNNRAALSALGSYNLKWTLQAAEEGGEDPGKVISALSGGPGSNLLVQWFLHRDSVSETVKGPLRRLARDVLVQYAAGLGKELIGDRSRGVLEGESLRSYVPGDDPALIDLSETIENIVMQGKDLSLVSSEDFTVRETVHGRRAVALLIDISGSMQGEKLTWCSIAAAMLAYALRPDELALAFFESNTHAVKNFSDRIEIETIADELLSLQSRGGTMLGRGLDWMIEELRRVGHRNKNALILTDAGIFDLDDCAGPCRMLAALHASTTWFVPQSDFARSEADVLAKWSRGSTVQLHENWKQFPTLIREALK